MQAICFSFWTDLSLDPSCFYTSARDVHKDSQGICCGLPNLFLNALNGNYNLYNKQGSQKNHFEILQSIWLLPSMSVTVKCQP